MTAPSTQFITPRQGRIARRNESWMYKDKYCKFPPAPSTTNSFAPWENRCVMRDMQEKDQHPKGPLHNQDNETIYNAVEICLTAIGSGKIFERYFGLHLKRVRARLSDLCVKASSHTHTHTPRCPKSYFVVQSPWLRVANVSFVIYSIHLLER